VNVHEPRPDQVVLGNLRAVNEAPSEDFCALLKIGGLDPRKDLRFHDWSDVSFAGADLRNMDFTGAWLLNCDFTDALIVGARFDRAVIGRVGLDSGQRTNLRKARDWSAYATGWEKASTPPADGHLPVGAIFQDAPFGPEMVVVPAGEFLMGSAEDEAKLKEEDKASKDEIVPNQGKRRMRIARRFALGSFPVTFEEYDAFLTTMKCARGEDDFKAADLGLGRGRRPAINVSWQDAQNYCAWLNRTTGLRDDFGYRLPAESEWEYACRAGTNSRRWWGDSWDSTNANGARRFENGKTSPVGYYAANSWGLYDMIGNVLEWCADHYCGNISMLPADGAAYAESVDSDLFSRLLRGGSWGDNPLNLRSADRSRLSPLSRGSDIGFRVARTLLPPSS
jgi:formylglycine-generating enzyme required for sulfatase activity